MRELPPLPFSSMLVTENGPPGFARVSYTVYTAEQMRGYAWSAIAASGNAADARSDKKEDGGRPPLESEPWVAEVVGSSKDGEHELNYCVSDIDKLPIGTKLYASPPAGELARKEKP